MLDASLKMQAPGTAGRQPGVNLPVVDGLGQNAQDPEADAFSLLQPFSSKPETTDLSGQFVQGAQSVVAASVPVPLVVPVVSQSLKGDDSALFSDSLVSNGDSSVSDDIAKMDDSVATQVDLTSVKAKISTEDIDVDQPVLATSVPFVPMTMPNVVLPQKEAGPVSTQQSVETKAEATEDKRNLESGGESEKKEKGVEKSVEAKDAVSGSEVKSVEKKEDTGKEAATVPAASGGKDAGGKVKLPMTYEEAVKKGKKGSFRNAARWLAGFLVRQWRKLDPTVGR